MSQRIPQLQALIDQMTLQEKVGQLNLPVGDFFNTGPTVRTSVSNKFDQQIRDGKLTGLFNIYGTDYIRKLQKIAVEESRLGIPLVIGADVIHGFRTLFPIPLGEAASWDLEAIEMGAKVAAIESTAVGISFNFAPTVDISREPRWGRTSEGAGEDPYYGSLVAAARVKGFQGDDLADDRTMAACIKHFAAYGAPEGGREYTAVDMSERTLREVYLPPYKAAVDAGAATLMTSFNELNGVPATGNEFLLKQILREEWGFKGMVVSDWASISEMVIHGYSEDRKHSAEQAIHAGVDMDMMADAYLEDLPELVEEGKVDLSLINEAVYNVLKLKWDLGLFENPYKYVQPDREKNEIRSKENLACAFDMAKKSIVLLKNENSIAPLQKSGQKIAVIGPLADSKPDMNGSWSFFAESDEPVTFLEGIRAKAPEATITFAEGCNLYDDDTTKFEEAVKIAAEADVLVLAIGEAAVMNGEGAARSDIGLPGIQLDLVKELHKLGKPIVALVSSGRPLAIPWLEANVDAIFATWSLGSEAGNAVAEVLFGDYNPSGKLPITWPRNVGQVPIYHSMKNTGRPYMGDYSEGRDERVYLSRYRDVQNDPLFPFGFGLSYTQFEYGEPVLSAATMKSDGEILLSVDVKNVGDAEGEEVVQFYLRDLVGSVTRPVKELKGFEKIKLSVGEKTTVEFRISEETLSFHRKDMSFGSEPGKFHAFVGTNSRDVSKVEFELLAD